MVHRGERGRENRDDSSLEDELDARDRRAVAEVLPFVILVLRAEREAADLRVARVAAASSREEERRRLRRDLHDGVGPLLASQLVTLDTIRVARDKGQPVDELFAALEEHARSAIGEIRSITRDLRPAALDVGGLQEALAKEIGRVRTVSVETTVELGETILSSAMEVNVLRIVQEALANVVRHSNATNAGVRVVVDEDVEVDVVDNGVGRAARPWTAGVGTTSMRERAEELGGTLVIRPGPDGRGTHVRARIPL